MWIKGTYHCGKVSSHRICLLLHVLQPLRDLVWLLRGGPPPGPTIFAEDCRGIRTGVDNPTDECCKRVDDRHVRPVVIEG